MAEKTPKEIKQFRDYIRAIANELRDKVYAQEYSLAFSFNEEITNAVSAQDEIRAEIRVNSVYLRITLSIYKPIFDLWKDNKLEDIYEILVHEFCHILTLPLATQLKNDCHPQNCSFIDDIHERQTQRIANVILYSNFATVPWKKKLVNSKMRK